MARKRASSCIKVLESGRDRLTYCVTLPPEAMPPVTTRALEQAWDAAHEASPPGATPRRFRFLGEDGQIADFDLTDRDAQSWAGAVDRVADLATLGGIALCLRLLALIDLMATAPWALGYMTSKRDGGRLDRALVRAAARANLTGEARFDEAALRRILPERPFDRAGEQPFTGVSV